MPTPSSGRESRRSSRSGPSGSEAHQSNDRRAEKLKSSQSHSAANSDARRGGVQPIDAALGRLPERTSIQSRARLAPLVDYRNGPGVDAGITENGGGRNDGQAGAGLEENGQDEDEVAGVVGAVRQYRPFQSPELSEPLTEINIAIIGAEGVGKSTFVQRVLDLPYLPPSQAAERRIPVDGNIYLVRLLELPLDEIDIDDDNTVSWPDTIEDKVMPRVDGALTLYSIKDRTSLEAVPEMLRAISRASVPSVLISNKCDAQPSERELDPAAVEQRAKQSISDLTTLQGTASNPETHKRGMSLMLRAIIFGVPESQRRNESANRPRAHSNTVRSGSPAPSRGHSRASSEYTGSTHKDQKHARHDSSLAGYGSGDRLRVPRQVSQEGMAQSFLLEESASEDGSHESVRSTTSGEIARQPPEYASTTTLSENGATFDQLVERLLAQPLSKADTKFVAIFLALYRKFAAPGRLLEAVAERFDALEKNNGAQLIKTSAQMRYLNIVEQWVGTYPGDFAFPMTKRRLRTFVAKIGQVRIFAVAAKEMTSHLEQVQEDDDTGWAYTDKGREIGLDYRASSVSTTSTLIDDPHFTFENELGGATMSNANVSAVTVTGGDANYSGAGSSATSSQIVVSVAAAQQQAMLLQPTPRTPVNKSRWHNLMDQPDDAIARELTRMDWIMFSSIRPRDLVRQVSLSAADKTKCKNLVHVNRMIEHFNQIACWVKNYVLVRDKPKHRALMLEKFMRVARKLRELNNYNSLGAIIAGVKSSEVHRLAATRELIPPLAGKDWLKLEVLMAPSRSHAAYRLAWENSSSERIPYLPLHRRDLVSAEEGNRTFVGDEREGRINWKKFEVMGEVIVSLQKAQGMPYRGLGGGRGEKEIKELVLDVKLEKDEEALYERSIQCEPPANSGGTTDKLKSFFKR